MRRWEEEEEEEEEEGGGVTFKRVAQSPPSTYSMTMHRCFLVSKLHWSDTTNGLSVKHNMSRSANACST